MKTCADNTQENKSQSVANAFSQKQHVGESTFQFDDNRPEAVAQWKLREMANSSPQVSQLSAFQDMANNNAQVNNATSMQVAYSKPPAAGAASLRSAGPREAIVQRRLVSDEMLQDDFNRTQKRTGERGLTLLEVLTDIAADFKISAPVGTDEAGLIALLVKDSALDAEDVAFLRHRAQPHERSEAYAVQQDDQRQKHLEATANEAKKNHRESLRPAASKALSRNERKQKKIGAADVEQKIEKYLDEHEGEGIQQIENQLALDKAASANQMPADFATKKQQYDDYLAQTNNHLLSFPVLDFANNSFPTAQKIIETIAANPVLAVLATDPASSRQLWNRFINRFGKEVGAAIVARIQVTGVVQYDAADSGFELLNALHAKSGITDGKLQQIGQDMNSFVVYAADEGARKVLATLLVTHDVANLLQVFAAMPDNMIPAVNKPEDFAVLWPHASSYPELIAGIQLAAKIGLSRLSMKKLITALPANSNATAIRGAISANSMAEFSKTNQFPRWIHAIDQLIATEHFTIGVGNSTNLPGDGGVFERKCKVYDAARVKQDTFVIHYHPGAKKATAKQPNASSKHIKPISGDITTVKLLWDLIPTNVRTLLPDHH